MGTAILAFLSATAPAIIQIIASIFGWVAKRAADVQGAAQGMADDIASHLNDGKQSVAEEQSVVSQDQQLKDQAAKLDAGGGK